MRGAGYITRIIKCSRCGHRASLTHKDEKGERQERSDCPKCGAMYTGKEDVVTRARVRVGRTIESKTYTKRALADDWRRKTLGKRTVVDAGLAPLLPDRGSKPDVTYGELIDSAEEWFTTSRENRPTDQTLAGYLRELKIVRTRWGRRRVRETKKADVDAWRGEMQKQGLAPQTIRNRMHRLRQLHDMAVDRGYLPDEPCRVVRPRPRRNERPRRSAATEAEIAVAMKRGPGHAPDKRAIAALLLAFDAGLRREEIARLRVEQIDLNHAAEGTHGWLRGVLGKGDKLRDVPIRSARLARALKTLSTETGRTAMWPIESGPGLDHMLARELGHNSPGLHRCRHGCATRWANDPKLPLFKVQLWLGHEDIRTTQGYVHLEGTAPPPKEHPRSGKKSRK